MKLLKAFCLVTVLFALGTLMGCGISESKYVGTYIYEEELALGKMVFKLELKRDGTYRSETKGPYVGPYVNTGEWRVIKAGGEEGIGFTPFLPLLLGKSREKGYYFYNPSAPRDIMVKQK